MPNIKKSDVISDRKLKKTIPKSLFNTYIKFVNALYAGDVDEIKKYFLLPKHIEIESFEKSEDIDYGRNINLPFIRDRFDKRIWRIMKKGESIFLIRTGTTALTFVETKKMGWLLIEYFDKPIR